MKSSCCQRSVERVGGMVALSAVILIAAIVIFDVAASGVLRSLAARRRSRDKAFAGIESSMMNGHFGYEVSPGAFHHRGHLWLHFNKDGKAVVGIDDVLHRVVGRIDEIKIPEPGTRLARDEKAVMIRQGEKVLYLPSPAAGVVAEVNSAAAADSTLVKRAPYGDGWLFRIEPTALDSDMHYLLIMRRADAWLKRETRRMRRFFADMLHKGAWISDPDKPLELEGIVERLDYGSWVDFKNQFIYQQEWRH